MAELSVLLDREGRTLTVWFSDRRQEYVCEETGDEVVMVKDRRGKVIGFEKMDLLPGNRHTIKHLPVEVSVS